MPNPIMTMGSFQSLVMTKLEANPKWCKTMETISNSRESPIPVPSSTPIFFERKRLHIPLVGGDDDK